MNDADAIARIAVSREHVRWLRGASSPHNDLIADGIESLLATANQHAGELFETRPSPSEL